MGKTQKKPAPTPESLAPFLAPLKAVQDVLDAFGGRGVIIGGIAASLLGKPRFTADVDAVILLDVDEIPRLLQRASENGIQPRITNAESFARKNRVLLLRHFVSGIDIDISLGTLPFENEMVAHSRIFKLGGIQLRLPTPEDLVILKAVAHRPQDMLDIDSIIASHPALDSEYIRNWVQQFADALEIPELLSDLSNHLKQP